MQDHAPTSFGNQWQHEWEDGCEKDEKNVHQLLQYYIEAVVVKLCT